MALITKQELGKLADKALPRSSTQTAVQQALIEQVTQYIAQYTPQPRIISYKPNSSGDVMGKFESQSRVFIFRLSGKGLVYKPLVQRKDNESDDDYALRFDTGSELWLEHFDAAKAFKPKPSVTVKKERGTKAQPKCSAISYHCGVCISLGKNCIKNANTAALKERLQKINSLSRMAAKGEAVPQVKTGVIGAKVDPASLKRKVNEFVQKQAGGKKSTNPKAKGMKQPVNSNDVASWDDERLTKLKQTLEDNIATKKEAGEEIPAGWTKRYSEVLGETKRRENGSPKVEPNTKAYSLPVYGHPENHSIVNVGGKLVRANFIPFSTSKDTDLDWRIESAQKLANQIGEEYYSKEAIAKGRVKATAKQKKEAQAFISSSEAKSNLDVRETLNNETVPELYRLKKAQTDLQPTPKQSIKDRQSAARAAAEPNKTTTLATPLPLTAQSQKRLERGESISDNETYHVKKEGDKFRVTDPNKFEDKGKLVDKAGLAAHMKELESKPSAVKKSSSMNPVIPINNNPDTMLRALRDGRLIGDAKQGYEIQQRGKDEYLVTTMPNKNGDYSGVMSRKELVDFVKGGGDGSRFNKEKQESKSRQTAKEFGATKAGRIGNQVTGKLKENLKSVKTKQQELKDRESVNLAVFGTKKPTQKQVDDVVPIKDRIPLTSGKNLTPSQKKQSRTADQVAIDRTKSDVSNATKRINTLDDSIKKLKAGKGVMSEADLKKVASLERQKAEWEKTREGHRAKLEKLAKPVEAKPEPRLAQTDLFGNPVAIPETPSVTVKAKPKAKKESSKVDVFTPEMKSYAEKVLKDAEKGVQKQAEKVKAEAPERERLEKLTQGLERPHLFKNVDPKHLDIKKPQVTQKGEEYLATQKKELTDDVIARALEQEQEAAKYKRAMNTTARNSNAFREANRNYEVLQSNAARTLDKAAIANILAEQKGEKRPFGSLSVLSYQGDNETRLKRGLDEGYGKAGFVTAQEVNLSSEGKKVYQSSIDKLKEMDKSNLKPITIDLTQFGGGKYEVKPTPEAIKTFRDVLAKAKTQTDANFKSSGGGLSKATEKEYKEALLVGDIDKATYDLLVGNNTKEFPDTIKLQHGLKGKGSFASVNAKKVGNYAVHQKFSGVTDDDEAITSPKEYTLTHLGSGMKLKGTDEMGDTKTSLKVKKARLEGFATELSKRMPDIDADNLTTEQKKNISAIVKELTEKAKRGDYDPRKDSADLYHVNIPNSILVSRQDADDCILTYVTDNSGNLMGVCQINGVKYRFLKPVFGATVLTPLSETGLGYLFDLAPDLSLTQATGNPFDGIFDPFKKALAPR